MPYEFMAKRENKSNSDGEILLVPAAPPVQNKSALSKPLEIFPAAGNVFPNRFFKILGQLQAIGGYAFINLFAYTRRSINHARFDVILKWMI